MAKLVVFQKQSVRAANRPTSPVIGQSDSFSARARRFRGRIRGRIRGVSLP
jgi:hypothetical protein